MTEPLVSIIIPAYNSEKYFASTIQSALNQSWSNKEIIIVDDGSTDSSLVLAKTFESERVKVFYQDNKGASAARNKGLNEAKGEFIQFLDADDLLSPGKIEEQIKMLKDNPGCICLCPTINFTDDEDYSKKMIDHHWVKDRSDDPVDFLIKLYGGALVGPEYGGLVTIHSWLCPRYVVDKAGNWNESLSVDDDGEYFCRVILASAGIIYAPNAINYYRKHSQHTNLSASRSLKGYQSLIDSTNLKFGHLYKASNNKEIVNKIFARIYNDFAINTYPFLKKQSDYALKKAKSLWSLKPEYKAGPMSNILIKIFGWRIVRALNYYRHGL
jgi:glycosyltransferase involved in cell wall biosynthesis